MSKIAICTVNYNSNELINLNYRLSQFDDADWFVYDNSPEHNIPLDSKVNILRGHPQPTKFPDFFRNKYDLSDGYVKSYCHGRGINELLKEIDGYEYIVILDPDFFIVNDIQNYLFDDLDFFGVPTHPLCYNNNGFYDIFPSPICMIINTKTVDIKKLNFLPGLDILNHTEQIADTGCRIANEKNYKYKLTIPTFTIKPNKQYEYPKFTTKTFGEAGYFDADDYGWEEYWYNNVPFGIHTRTRTKLKNKKVVKQKHANHIVENLGDHLLNIEIAIQNYRGIT